MDQSPRLALPYLLPGQAQKHVTHNEALRRLDALVQLAVLDRMTLAPPSAAEEGACWIVAEGAGGDWSGHGNEIAAWQDGAWAFLEPGTGWRVWVEEEAALLVWEGASWQEAVPPPGLLQDLTLLGLGTSADAANPFAAKLNKALWTARYEAEGGDGSLRYTLNKEAPDRTVSLLLQSDWSGRAEIGLTGDDDLRIKVSADGTSWNEALVLDRAGGSARLPGGLVHPASGQVVSHYLPSPVKEIWRIDASRPATPRSYVLGDAAGTVLTLSTAQAGEIFSSGMEGNVAVRVWNTSKVPAEAAWVDWKLSASELQVTDASHIAGWAAGETLRLGDPDPTGDNTLDMVALDISPYLYSQLGAVFPQKGVMAAIYVSSADGPAALGLSADGSQGSVFGGNALSDGSPNQMAFPLPANTLSPISNSHLVFLREKLTGNTSDIQVTYVRVLGVYV